MLKISSNFRLDDAETVLLHLAKAPEHDRYIELPASYDNQSSGVSAAIAQCIMTWAHRFGGQGFLITKSRQKSSNDVAMDYTGKLPGIVAACLAKEVRGPDQVLSLTKAFNEALDYRFTSMNKKDFQNTQKGKSVLLMAADEKSSAKLDLLYAANINDYEIRNDPFIDDAEFEVLVKKILSSMLTPTRVAKITGDNISSIASVARELFANTYFHARTNADGTSVRKPIRGIYFSFQKIEQGNVYWITGEDRPLQRYIEYQKSRFGDNTTFLEVSVFDNGPGLAARVMGRELNEDDGIDDEYKSVSQCFKRGFTTRKIDTAGQGLHELIAILKTQAGYFRLRSGRLSLFKQFKTRAPWAQSLSEQDLELLDTDTQSSRPTKLPFARGTLFTVLLPLNERM
ncbi:hypothetical protein HHL28_15560 [Aerophototrophica crusticola]|uniref:ATP-binding protein n=1 Tax=Aerophototrophica crusticola TaxID=1709002 RepID=A0A858RBG2_9PROT|nr:hypothetical protein HHL28_15560 [Rhodospirillaceae bacterium B3]